MDLAELRVAPAVLVGAGRPAAVPPGRVLAEIH